MLVIIAYYLIFSYLLHGFNMGNGSTLLLGEELLQETDDSGEGFEPSSQPSQSDLHYTRQNTSFGNNQQQ